MWYLTSRGELVNLSKAKWIYYSYKDSAIYASFDPGTYENDIELLEDVSEEESDLFIANLHASLITSIAKQEVDDERTD